MESIRTLKEYYKLIDGLWNDRLAALIRGWAKHAIVRTGTGQGSWKHHLKIMLNHGLLRPWKCISSIKNGSLNKGKLK
jgi:hypothetical protein